MDEKRKIILSVDYEIFGNGGGDVMQHVVRPTEAMARICDRYDVPLTVFFEVEEYLAFVRYAKELTALLRYNPAEAIRSQLISLLNAGHDVQLHLHPEWYGATFLDKRWRLNPEKRAVDHLFESQAETTAYIRDRKAVVDEIISKSNPTRRVRVYRAGAFTAQPGRKLITALAENGILIDSSVVKGLHSRRPDGIDFRNAPSAKGPWRVDEDVAVPAPDGKLWEFPVYSVMGRRFNQLTLGRLRAKFSRNVPRERQAQMLDQLGVDRRSPVSLAKFLFQHTPVKLDFHNVAPRKFVRWAKAAPKPSANLPDVVVSIGHTKEHLDDAWFEAIVRGIVKGSEVKIVGFEEVAEKVIAFESREQSAKKDVSWAAA